MPTLRIRFPGGRYHATPWGHHVNEGLIEWPPCPWRLLRALLACGYATRGWSNAPPVARQLIDKLAAVLPSYHLPDATAAHSRHFMPCLEGRNQRTTLVFDTWATVGNGDLLVHWPCELNLEESHLLRQLAAALGYLGRSESWVEAELVEDAAVEWNAVPCRHGEHRGREWEQVSLLAPIPEKDYESWRSQQMQMVLKPFEGKKETKKLQKDRDKAQEPYPCDLLSSLTKDNSWWQRHRWSQPPGSRRVLYWRRSDSLQVGAPQRARPRMIQPVTTMLLALTTPSGNRSALPPCRRTLPQAELFHRAIVGRAGNGQRVHCPELTGRDEQGRPLRDGHRHAHVLPVDLDGDGHLDHLIVYAPMGLGTAAQQAIRKMKRTWTKGGVGDLQLALVGSGDLDALRSLPAPLDRRIGQLLGPRDGARVWVSATPFVPPRFLKRRGANTLLGQVNSELASRQLPLLEEIELLPRETIAFRHYVRLRQRGGAPPPTDVGYAIRLRLAEPISGPVALGYASHFGLGLFAADEA